MGVSSLEGRQRMRVRSRLLQVGGAAALLLAVVLAFQAGLVDPVNLKQFILSFGVLAPFIWVALYLVAVFIPYATTVMTIAAGLAFGTLWGTLLTYSVTLFASLLPLTVARRLGRRWVEEKLARTPVKRYADLINENAFLVFFYLRLIPSLPYEVQNYIAGVSRISYRQFVLASSLGVGPILFILAFLGDSLTDPGSPEFWLATGIFLFALVAPLLYTLVAHRLRRRPAAHGDPPSS